MERWILFGLLGAVAFVWLTFWFASRAATKAGIIDVTETAKFKDSYTKTVAQVLGGAFVILTLAWTVNKDSESLRQTATTSANQQFVEAAKLMSSDQFAARTAGNFAYEKLVEARPEYTKSVRNTLLALVRGKQPNEATVRTSLEVSAALSTLGKLPISADNPYMFRDLCFAAADFSASTAFKNADFQGAKLYGANFTWAQLQGVRFNGAMLAEHRFYDGDLVAHLSGDRNVADSWWGWERYRYIVNFDNSDLTSAHFEDTSVAGASFQGANLKDARFYASDISRADFTGANNIDLQLFEGACFGSTVLDRQHSEPRGLPRSFMQSLTTCRVGVVVDDIKQRSSCPRETAGAQP